MSPLALSLRFLQAQPDGRLVALARDGHEPAFEALVRRYRTELLAYCRRLQPHSGGAEDALQQTFLQAWRAITAGAEVREVRPWLYRIAHNVTLNSLRVAVAAPRRLPDTAATSSVDQVVEQRFQARAALAGMAALPELQRQVFVSATLDGASHDEVAAALGLTSGAVRGLIYRARALVRTAAAAVIPSPVLSWAIRRAGGGGGSAAVEAVAGGGGAGVVALVAKGGAVLSVAGAVAGGAVIAQNSHHHRQGRRGQESAQTHVSRRPSDARLGAAALTLGSARPAARPVALRPVDTRGRSEHGSSLETEAGRNRGSPDRSDDGSPAVSSQSSRSDDGSNSGANARSGGETSSSGRDGSGGSGSSGPDGGSDGAGTSSSGSDGGSSGGGPTPSGADQLLTSVDGGSGGGSSDGPSSDSVDTETAGGSR